MSDNFCKFRNWRALHVVICQVCRGEKVSRVWTSLSSSLSALFTQLLVTFLNVKWVRRKCGRGETDQKCAQLSPCLNKYHISSLTLTAGLSPIVGLSEQLWALLLSAVVEWNVVQTSPCQLPTLLGGSSVSAWCSTVNRSYRICCWLTTMSSKCLTMAAATTNQKFNQPVSHQPSTFNWSCCNWTGQIYQLVIVKVNMLYAPWPKVCGHTKIPPICDCWTSCSKTVSVNLQR